MDQHNSTASNALFELDGKPALKQAFPLALQHLVAMIVGCVTPAIILSGIVKLSDQDSVILIQSALICSAITTFVELFPLGGKKSKFRLGAGLPVIMGVSFAYLPSMQAIAGSSGLAAIFGAQIVGGVVAFIVGLFIDKIRKFFPPMIAGTVVFTIGLSLYPTAVNYMAGGLANPNYGSWQNWLVALFTLTVVTVLNHFGKGILKLSSILIGVIAGYLLAACFGMVNFDAVAAANLIQMPKLLHFGVVFEPSACIAIGLLFAINSVQAIGDFTATTTGALGRQPEDAELKGGITAYGVMNLLSALFGGLPTATYSQNVGIVTTTKVVSRYVLGLSGIFILIAGLLPKFSALLTTIPQCVLGGATVSVFASIAMTGMKLIGPEGLNYRNTSIIGLSVALGMGITQASSSLSGFPEWVDTVFGKSPVVVATLAAIMLNIILPKQRE